VRLPLAPIDRREELAMTAILTEVQTPDKMVEIAREQVDAFSKGDWECARAALAFDSRLNELGTQRKIEGPEKIVELFKGWKQASPDAARHGDELVRQR
jgi:hypothetical protein